MAASAGPERARALVESIERRVEIVRLHWLKSCEARCFPPVERDLEIIQSMIRELMEIVHGQETETR